MVVAHKPRMKVHRVHEVEEQFDTPIPGCVCIARPMFALAEPRQAVAVATSTSSILYGHTDHFRVYYDKQLGTDGPKIASAMLKSCENDYATLQGIFSGPIPDQQLPFRIRLTTDSTGAYHESCEATTIFVGAYSGPGMDMGFIRSLVIAEEDEVFEALLNNQWDCGASNGEGLSRVLANDMVPGVEPQGFVSAPVWLNSQRQDFVNHTDPTDTNYFSIGCSVLFLNWLHTQLGYDWQDIVRAGGATLADTYKNLTGGMDGWNQFSTMIDEHYPKGTPEHLDTDNPFPLP